MHTYPVSGDSVESKSMLWSWEAPVNDINFVTACESSIELDFSSQSVPCRNIFSCSMMISAKMWITWVSCLTVFSTWRRAAFSAHLWCLFPFSTRRTYCPLCRASFGVFVEDLQHHLEMGFPFQHDLWKPNSKLPRTGSWIQPLYTWNTINFSLKGHTPGT